VLCLTTFETRMIRADLIQVLKILHNIDHVDKDKFFTVAIDNSLGKLKTYKARITSGISDVCP